MQVIISYMDAMGMETLIDVSVGKVVFPNDFTHTK